MAKKPFGLQSFDKRSLLMLGILALVVGLCMIIFNTAAMHVICYSIGGLLLLVGRIRFKKLDQAAVSGVADALRLAVAEQQGEAGLQLHEAAAQRELVRHVVFHPVHELTGGEGVDGKGRPGGQRTFFGVAVGGIGQGEVPDGKAGQQDEGDEPEQGVEPALTLFVQVQTPAA